MHRSIDTYIHTCIHACMHKYMYMSIYIYVTFYIHRLTGHVPVTHQVLNYARRVARSGGVKYVKRFSHWDQRKWADKDDNRGDAAKRFCLQGI